MHREAEDGDAERPGGLQHSVDGAPLEALDDFLDVGTGPIARYVEEGLLPLRSIWSKPKGTTE